MIFVTRPLCRHLANPTTKDEFVASAPLALFFTSASERLALARQRYFEDGQLPSGSIKNTVLESWSRCRRLSFNSNDKLDFNLVSTSRAHLALQRNRHLVEAWQVELAEIERTLSGTTCSAILTDSSGVLIATTGTGDSQAVITPMAHRVGVNLSEECAGTTAPGLVLKTGNAATVLGGEHFFEVAMPMHCAAAPIHNTHGELAGVLDISSEGRPFDFDMTALVGLYATSIENRLLTSQSNDHLVLRLQVSPALLDTPLVGLVGIDGQGRLAWMNKAASSLLGENFKDLSVRRVDVGDVFGITLRTLLGLQVERMTPVRLTNGLTVWICGALHARDGIAPQISRVSTSHEQLRSNETVLADQYPLPQQTPEEGVNVMKDAPSLRESDTDLILRTVNAFGGNISKAAKQLRVSRGLIYRRLKTPEETPP
ncbi:MAG TPA: Fis family transcriptional regulator [Curvibacter sp.]|nr:Fis family transcriptional regulator [Curvibacter sp.]